MNERDADTGVTAVGRMAVVVALALVSSTRAQAASCVDVDLQFRVPELTHGLVAATRAEAASIWRSYGVEIAWMSSTRLARCETPLGILDVLVDRDTADEIADQVAQPWEPLS